MATTFIRVPQTGGAPEDYLVSGAADIDLLSASAHFDGSGAGVDFFPAVQVLDEAGQVAATVVGPKVTAGGSADVTFAPFLEAPSTGGGADPLAVHFDTNPQPGHFLFTQTDQGVDLADRGGASTGFRIESGDGAGGGGFISITTDDGEVFTGSTSIVERLNPAGGTYEVQNHGGTRILQVQESGYFVYTLPDGTNFNVRGPFGRSIIKVEGFNTAGTNTLGFFGVGPVTQQATPVTLGDVIALLQAYGLSA